MSETRRFGFSYRLQKGSQDYDDDGYHVLISATVVRSDLSGLLALTTNSNRVDNNAYKVDNDAP